MSTLYDLTNDFRMLLEMADDPDVDEQTLADTMDGLQGELHDKADGYAKVIQTLKARMKVIKEEEERLYARRKTIEANVDRMKAALETAMIAANDRKFKTDLFSFGIQKNPASVVVDELYIENIPEEYLIQQEPKIDRKKIAEDIKAGKDLEGIAHLVQSEGLRIR